MECSRRKPSGSERGRLGQGRKPSKDVAVGKTQPQSDSPGAYWRVNGTPLFSLEAERQDCQSVINCRSYLPGEDGAYLPTHYGIPTFQGSFELLAAKPHGSWGDCKGELEGTPAASRGIINRPHFTEQKTEA